MLKDHILNTIALTPDFPYKDLQCSRQALGWVPRMRLLVTGDGVIVGVGIAHF